MAIRGINLKFKGAALPLRCKPRLAGAASPAEPRLGRDGQAQAALQAERELLRQAPQLPLLRRPALARLLQLPLPLRLLPLPLHLQLLPPLLSLPADTRRVAWRQGAGAAIAAAGLAGGRDLRRCSSAARAAASFSARACRSASDRRSSSTRSSASRAS